MAWRRPGFSQGPPACAGASAAMDTSSKAAEIRRRDEDTVQRDTALAYKQFKTFGITCVARSSVKEGNVLLRNTDE